MKSAKDDSSKEEKNKKRYFSLFYTFDKSLEFIFFISIEVIKFAFIFQICFNRQNVKHFKTS